MRKQNRLVRAGWLLLVVAPGCNEVFDFREGQLAGEAACKVVDDCEVNEPACRSASCVDGGCVYDDMPEGAPVAAQGVGDCVEVLCDGKGATKVVPLPTDVEDDGNPCTLDQCNGATPTHTTVESAPCYTGRAGTAGKGICQMGVQQCDAAGNPVGDCVGEVVPSVENCASDLDDDCDGLANEEGAGCVCVPTVTYACYTGPLGTAGVGLCHEGSKVCDADGLTYGACIGEQIPAVEDCDAANQDEDCDGNSNEEGTSCVCGDGFVSVLSPPSGYPETCDDGGAEFADGCDPYCQLETVQWVAVGSTHSCALVSYYGHVKCWGLGLDGQLGVGNNLDCGDEPDEMGAQLMSVDLGSTYSPYPAVGGAYSCVLDSNYNYVKCWGSGKDGRLGAGDATNRGDQPGEMGDALPKVDLGANYYVNYLSAGDAHVCAGSPQSGVKCWGAGAFGRLGLGDTNNRGDEPGEMGDALPLVELGSYTDLKNLSAGGAHTCVLLSSNFGSSYFAKCWGAGALGRLGLGDTNNRGDAPGEMGDALPAVNLGTHYPTQLSAGADHTCAILDDGSVKCWGGNAFGQLGLGDTNNRGDEAGEMGDSLPVVDLSGMPATWISAGNHYTCVRLQDASVKCWGSGEFGKLGLGDTNARGDQPGEMGDSLPTLELGSGKLAYVVVAGKDHTCALLQYGSVKCWGAGGLLGLGDQQARGDSPGEMGDALPAVHLYNDAR